MKQFLALLDANKEWIFSGVGVAILLAVGRLIFKTIFKKTDASSTQTIHSGDSSTNVQVGRDVIIASKKKKKKR